MKCNKLTRSNVGSNLLLKTYINKCSRILRKNTRNKFYVK